MPEEVAVKLFVILATFITGGCIGWQFGVAAAYRARVQDLDRLEEALKLARRAQERVADWQQFYRHVIDDAPDLVVLKSRTWWN